MGEESPKTERLLNEMEQLLESELMKWAEILERLDDRSVSRVIREMMSANKMKIIAEVSLHSSRVKVILLSTLI